jgi:hypothetical protein
MIRVLTGFSLDDWFNISFPARLGLDNWFNIPFRLGLDTRDKRC